MGWLFFCGFVLLVEQHYFEFVNIFEAALSKYFAQADYQKTVQIHTVSVLFTTEENEMSENEKCPCHVVCNPTSHSAVKFS